MLKSFINIMTVEMFFFKDINKKRRKKRICTNASTLLLGFIKAQEVLH